VNHDRFEALAGAVLLGEASEAERAAFAAHAPACAQCRSDAAAAPVLIRAIEAAREAETWRPRVDRAVLGRIRDSRSSRFRVTIGALGWAIALSIVLNVALASGLSGRFAGAFRQTGEAASDGTAMKFRLESPAPRRALAARPAPRQSDVAVVPHRRARKAVAARAPFGVAPRAPEPAGERADRADDVPDLLAGIDIDGRAVDGAKHVAVEPRPACEGAATRAEQALGDAPAPCPVSPADLPR
jgi:hypothetical protein